MWLWRKGKKMIHCWSRHSPRKPSRWGRRNCFQWTKDDQYTRLSGQCAMWRVSRDYILLLAVGTHCCCWWWRSNVILGSYAVRTQGGVGCAHEGRNECIGGKDMWELVDGPKNVKALDHRWVLRMNLKADSFTKRLRPLLVTKGRVQKAGTDYD